MTDTLKCSCGMLIQGKSLATVKENLKKHIESQLHKNQLARKAMGGVSEGGSSYEVCEDGVCRNMLLPKNQELRLLMAKKRALSGEQSKEKLIKKLTEETK